MDSDQNTTWVILQKHRFKICDNFPIFDDANNHATKADLYMLVHNDSVTDTNN